MIFVKEKSMHLLCVFSCSLSKKCPEIVLKFRKKLVLKFYFVLLGPVVMPSVRPFKKKKKECETEQQIYYHPV